MSTTGSAPEPGQLVDPAEMRSILARLDRLDGREPAGVTAAPAARPLPAEASPTAPYVVVSSTSIGTNRWEYTVSPVVGNGATSTHDGQVTLTAVTYKARNRYERMTKAGYASSGVASLRPIPNGAPIEARWSSINGTPILLFTDRNEPNC
jgi:hypothetical protein